MRSRTLSSIQRQRGYSLMEILVAVAIFATVMIIALLIYDQSNRVFKRANESAEMQQNTRIAFEKVVADLRMAGFDYKRAGTPRAGVPQSWTKDTDYSFGTIVIPSPPNGHVYRATKSGKSGAGAPIWKTGTGDLVTDNTLEWQESGAPVYEQPDEQIEFAHNRAITIRANFDYEDPSTPDHGRESELEVSSGGSFPIVTTGNDEIVTYALVSRSGNAAANKDKITFFADVQVKDGKPSREGYPGGKIEKEITITGVDFTNLYPPYTLMRYTLDANGNPQETALADNIRSMEFSYWQDSAAKAALTDITDTKITDFSTLAGLGQYNPAAPNAVIKERLIRGKVRAVTATIVGMSPQPDYDYKNPADTVASNFRQYSLQSTIVGRNLGMKGIPQSETDPPGPPSLTNSCTGYCGVAFLTWAPAPGTGNVTYTVLYDTSSSGSFSGVLPAGSQTSYAVDLTQFDLTKTYYFRVAATNDAGTTVSTGSPLALDLKNKTQPKAPLNVTATGKQDAIDVTFQPQSGNANGVVPTCQSGGAPADNFPAEVRGYRIYRSKDAAFDPAVAPVEVVLDENAVGLSGDGAGNFKFTDTNIVNCTNYYYKVATVEWCQAKDEYNSPANAALGLSAMSAPSGAAQSTAAAKPKQPLNLKQDVTSVCDPVANRCDPVKIAWEKVIRDVNNNDIQVDKYRITRNTKLAGVGSEMTVANITDGTTTWTDNSVLLHHVAGNVSQTFTHEYRVYALNCALESDPALLIYPGTCVTGATIAAEATGPGSGTPDDPLQNVESLTVVPHSTKPVQDVTVSLDGSAYTPLPTLTLDWDIQDGEVHTIAFRVVTADCTEILTYYVQADPADCAIRTGVSSVIGVTTQAKVVLANVSDEDVILDNVSIAWVGQSGLSWQNVRFPSGAVYPASFTSGQTAANARTVTFNPTAASDRLIKKGETATLLLNFTGGAVSPTTVGAVSADYHQGQLTTQFGCGSQLATCSVAATITAPANGTAIYIDVKNSSTEAISLSSIVITWSGQANWVWTSTTAGTTVTNSPALGSGTKTLPVSGVTIGAGDVYRVTMNMFSSANNPPDLNAANVTTVWTEYTTQISGNGTLTCRAK
jgi:prepilin-type N-terminal cleavage/methylation domain-containing protein